MSAYAVGMMMSGALVAWLGVAYRRRIWSLSMLLFSCAFVGTAWLANSWSVMAGMAVALLVCWMPVAIWAIAQGMKILPRHKEPS